MHHTFSFDYFGSTIEAESLGTDFLPNLTQTLTAHCMPLTKDGEIVAVHIVGRGIDIPGGHIEDHETAIETMQREALEEAYITVKNPVLIDVWRLASANARLGLSTRPYLILYAVNVETILDFIPSDEADKRLVVHPDEFVSMYFGDKEQAQNMVDKALAALR